MKMEIHTIIIRIDHCTMDGDTKVANGIILMERM